MKRYYLLILLAAFTGRDVIYASLPAGIQKQVVNELKKFSTTPDVQLTVLNTPSKYTLNGNFYLTGINSKYKYIYSGRVYTHRNSGVAANSGSEYIDYSILYNPDMTIQKVMIHVFKASAGQGVCAPGWLRQFVGLKPGSFLSVGRDIDAISGATSTVNSLTFDIQSKTTLLKEIAGVKTN